MEKNQMLESRIERSLAQGVRARGGLCLKFTSPGSPGVQDRLVVAPDGHVYFVEVKTVAGRLANIQRWMIGELEKRGADVRILRGMDAVKGFLDEI